MEICAPASSGTEKRSPRTGQPAARVRWLRSRAGVRLPLGGEEFVEGAPRGIPEGLLLRSGAEDVPA